MLLVLLSRTVNLKFITRATDGSTSHVGVVPLMTAGRLGK